MSKCPQHVANTVLIEKNLQENTINNLFISWQYTII